MTFFDKLTFFPLRKGGESMDSNDWTAIFTLGLLLVDILALVWNYKNKK